MGKFSKIVGRSRARFLLTMAATLLATLGWVATEVAAQQASDGGVITLKSDVQEANSVTGVITARGNVQIEYPSREIYATSAQAQYFSQERRIILSGNVVVTQEGNRLEAETVTYLIDEGRFVALPQPENQVRSTYIVPASPSEAGSSAENAPNPESPTPAVPDGTLQISPVESSETP